MSMTELAAEEYVALTTYRKNGESSSTPVWIADAGDGKLGLITGHDTLKVKRVRSDPRVKVQPSNAKGAPKDGTEPIDGLAEVVTGTDFEQVRAAVADKYGWKLTAIRALHRITAFVKRQEADDSDCALVITPVP